MAPKLIQTRYTDYLNPMVGEVKTFKYNSEKITARLIKAEPTEFGVTTHYWENLNPDDPKAFDKLVAARTAAIGPTRRRTTH